MPRYIDAEKIEYDKHKKIGLGIDYGLNESDTYYTTTKEKIDAIPTAAVVKVVRCKDCKWYDLTDPCGTLTPNAHRCKRVTRLWMEDDAYCSYGERREDEKSTKRTD